LNAQIINIQLIGRKYAMQEIEVLLIEDNPDDEQLTIRALKKYNLANKIVVVRSGIEALGYFFGPKGTNKPSEDRIPQIILLDLRMPEMDGLEVLRRLKANDATCDIPVIVLTSSDKDIDLQECFRMGANDFITKPVDFEGFAKVLSKLNMYWLLIKNKSDISRQESDH
jgi:two-component system response regulator